MRKIGIRRGMFVGLGVLAMTGLPACSAHGAPASAGPGDGQTASAVASPVASTQAASAPASPPAVAPSTTPTASGGVQNLVVTNAILSELTTDYVQTMDNIGTGISPSDVAGPLPGSVYYASGPAAGVYWALAEFGPSLTASPAVLADFQNGRAYFLWQRFGPTAYAWIAEPGGSPLVCEEVMFFPSAVLEAWGLPATVPAAVTCAGSAP